MNNKEMQKKKKRSQTSEVDWCVSAKYQRRMAEIFFAALHNILIFPEPDQGEELYTRLDKAAGTYTWKWNEK